jgi:aminopeptidase 2
MAIHALSRGVRPQHYDLTIEPDLSAETFKGTVTIEIDLVEALQSLTLNVRGLAVRSTKIQDNGISVPILDTKTDDERQTLTIVFVNPLPVSYHLTLSISYSAPLGRKGEGFHIPPGSNLMASTNLEATHARSVFPCFDDPSLKATFSVSLIVPKDLACIGNMPIASDTSTTSPTSVPKKVVKFEKTPLMSTYLVAFAVGEFNMIKTSAFHLPIRAYASKEYDIEHSGYALDIAGKALEILEKTFEIEYTIPKLDLLAVPGSFGGMENWGLITLATDVQIVHPDSSAEVKTVAAQTIVHEIAHQWFGNLVSIKSWDNCWLKEGLSEWAELEVREQMEHNWEPFQDFAAEGLQVALDADGKRFGHPLEIEIDGEAVKKPYFDEITYKKGCAVFRTLENHLGKRLFLEGIKKYLKQHLFGSNSTEDLWDALSEVSGKDVGAFMSTWMKNTGFPVLTIEEDEAAGTITVTQNRFHQLINGDSTLDDKDELLYNIPLKISTSKGTLIETVTGKSRLLSVPFGFYSLNADQTGFYRVAYPPSRLKKLGDDIREGDLSVADRIGLISDTSALVFSLHPSLYTSDLLTLLSQFQNEDNYFVWKAIISTLSQISKSLLFDDVLIKEAFTRFHQDLTRKCIDTKKDFALDDDINGQRFNELVFGNAGGNEWISKLAWYFWTLFMLGGEKRVNSNIRKEVFEIVLREGGKKEVCSLPT